MVELFQGDAIFFAQGRNELHASSLPQRKTWITYAQLLRAYCKTCQVRLRQMRAQPMVRNA